MQNVVIIFVVFFFGPVTTLFTQYFHPVKPILFLNLTSHQWLSTRFDLATIERPCCRISAVTAISMSGGIARTAEIKARELLAPLLYERGFGERPRESS